MSSYAKNRVAVALSVALAMLCGCALQAPPAGADLMHQAVPVLAGKPAWVNHAAAGNAADGWLASFDDAALQRLVHEAIAHNGDLRLAEVRVRQAQALVAIEGSGLLPDAAAKGRAGNSETQILSLGASWEIDLWGRIRAQARAGQARYAATRDDYLWARRVVAAATAQAWFTLVQHKQREARLRQAVAIHDQLLRIAVQRVAIGAAPDTEAVQARNARRLQADALASARLASGQAAQALELLLGRYPAGEIAGIADGRELPPVPAAPQAGLPADLLDRRPDLTAAAHQVAAAFDMRQSAQAARLPRLAISAAITAIRSDVFLLNQAGSPVRGLNASFFAPLFSGGELKARVDYFTAEQKAALIAYGDKALHALAEVEAGLQAESMHAERSRQLQDRVAESGVLVRREEIRAGVGASDMRGVLKARQSLLAAEIDCIDAHGRHLQQRIALLLALGGDWRDTAG
ncbi:TolC family protein [Cupriavidus neocaledonicus]|uniref:Efflux transporter, outer membrane factor (OMF) lipoprotein, NodT family n=1 Tax=Cupriavidus neocaledonicus TaxID=1040979 RepID=A0A375H7M7_9BURK|nr:TolC family protein [Cupriavidus neocaledonicus]SOZ34923.1 RND efflux system, outer membrane lipoprotein, NodT [Cupriavidus neocaledonicus]SPD46866.1 Efflux transporter, outer membrane factor (OMF) lipoprotein, NodT family [Cupriavidus neocaledonicus]